MNKYFKKFLSTIITYIFAVFTFMFFAPLEIYLGNISNFQIFANSAVAILFISCLIAAVTVSIILSFLPIKLLKILNIGVFSIGICFYIQSLFLNDQLISLTGDKQEFSTRVIVVNILIWFATIAFIFLVWKILKKIKKEKIYLTGIKFISVSLVIMQTVGLVSVYISCDKSVSSKNCYFSDIGEFEVSNNKNVLYFIIDTCSGDVAKTAFDLYPDVFDDLSGFTYYPNAVSTYSRTFPALPYLLSQEKCYFDIPSSEYVNNAFEKSNFIPAIKKLGTDIRIYTETAYIGDAVKNKIDNLSYISADTHNVNLVGFIKKSAKISLFRGSPYIIKRLFEYTAEDVNNSITRPIVDKAILNDDLAFYDRIKNDRVKINESYDSAFRFYHLFGIHPGVSINENAEFQPDVSYVQAFRGNMKILKEYFQQLKELGVYDKTTIIITADHGSSGGGSTLDLPGNASCLMLVKPADADSSQKIKISQAPVCHEDLFATVVDSLGGNGSEFGRNIREIGEEEKRQRLYYYSALYSDVDGEVALREYVVQGDAGKLENYLLTGNYWDINNSMNTVSDKRLK